LRTTYINDINFMKKILTLLLFLPLLSLGQSKVNRKIIKDILADKSGKQVAVDKVIPDAATAIAVAEPILFKIYSRDMIIREKPYSVSLVDGYWILTGSLPKLAVGGTFFIVLSAKDGRVIKLTHYQ